MTDTKRVDWLAQNNLTIGPEESDGARDGPVWSVVRYDPPSFGVGETVACAPTWREAVDEAREVES